MKLFRKPKDSPFAPIALQDFGSQNLEKALEDRLATTPSLLGDDLLLIGRQVRTAHGVIDLLAIDGSGHLHIIELKRGRSSRKVVGQLNSYLTIARDWSESDLVRIANLLPASRESNTLVVEHKRRFGLSVAPPFNRKQIGVVVAESFDKDFAAHLGGLKFQCRALRFSSFRDCDEEFWLMQVLHDTTQSKKRRPPRRQSSTPTRAATPEEQVLMDKIARWVRESASGRPFMIASEVIAGIQADTSRKTYLAVAKALRRLGWRKGIKRVKGRLTRGYFRAAPGEDWSSLGELV